MRLLLQLVRKMTSAAHDGGMDEWLRDYSIRDVSLITMIVELSDENSAKQDLAMCEEREPTLKKYLGNQGVSAGSMLAPCRHKLGLIKLYRERY